MICGRRKIMGTISWPHKADRKLRGGVPEAFHFNFFGSVFCHYVAHFAA